MTVDLESARSFLATHARLLDRRRFELLLGGTDRAGVLASLEGYRNDDGGYGWGLESDLRSSESQPAAALHAFEAWAEAAPLTSPRARELCDWLMSVSLPDGGLPFALPVGDAAGCAPWWAEAETTASSLQITSVVVANAHQVGEHDASVANHEWLQSATDYCLRAVAALDEEPHAYVLLFSVRLLDRIAEHDGEASDLLKALSRNFPADGIVHVEGGTEDEVLRPLDFAPDPARPARELFDADVIERELDLLAGEQQSDGGWPYEPKTFSPASQLEWRGYATVRAISTLLRNDRTT